MYRNRIRKLSSGAAADALDFGEGMKERSNVLNLDGNVSDGCLEAMTQRDIDL